MSLPLSLTFAGVNSSSGPAPASAPGVKVGDVIDRIFQNGGSGVDIDPSNDVKNRFESTVTVNDEIQQTAAMDLSSGYYFLAFFHRSPEIVTSVSVTTSDL